MENRVTANGSPQIKPKQTQTWRSGASVRVSVPVPSWYDLPLLLPDADAVVSRLQRRYLETLDGENNGAEKMLDARSDAAGFVLPKASRLSPEKLSLHPARSTTHWRKESGKMVLVRPRKTTLGGAAVVLDRIHHPNQGMQSIGTSSRPSRQRERLRDKLWDDLSRFGLWHIDRASAVEEEVDGGDDMRQQTADSVDATVEAIMNQWQQGDDGSVVEQEEDEAKAEEEEEEECSSSSTVFLTAVPVPSPSNAPSRVDEANPNRMPWQCGPEDDERSQQPQEEDSEGQDPEEQDDPADRSDSSLASRFRRQIHAPGLKRRQRLKELHVFVETQLQKRLFRSWESIEIALSGSGDLSVQQIVKYLQHSDVKLSAIDAAKVQSILHQHLEHQRNAAKQQADADADADEEEEGGEDLSLSAPPPIAVTAAVTPPVKLSYATFRKIFQPRDTQDAARWKRDLDREKLRLRQEKEIYDRELAALEAKVKQRLAESAKYMVEVLDTFRCDPLAIPWTTDAQRLDLRIQLLHVLFSKPRRRPVSDAAAAISASVLATPDGSVSTENPPSPLIPTTLSVPKIRSALLQKYSRNGHFDSVPVPVVAYLFHDLAADTIKTSIHALWTRRAIDLWPERQRIFDFRRRKTVFYEWRRFTKHAAVLRQFVLRKFVAWACWTRRIRAYHAFYRLCFWPLYVWKRFLQQQIIARGKSGFLKNVVVTYVQLRHFRAWQSQFRRKCYGRYHVQRLRRQRARCVLRTCWHAWYDQLRVHLQVLRVWKSRGHVLQQLHKGYMVKVTFLLWRYHTILQHDQHARQFKCLLAQFSSVGRTRAGQEGGGAIKLTGSGSPSRGVTARIASQPSTASLNHSRPATIAAGFSSSATGDGNERLAEDGENVRTLSKIMETDLAPKIKRKTRLYDLCLHLYLRCRERDRRAMTGNVICFRRIGRHFFRGLKNYVSQCKKNRLATDLGAFRHLHRRFRWWVAVAIYKHPLNAGSRNNHPEALRDSDGDVLNKSERADTLALDWKCDTAWRLHGLAHLPIEAEQLHYDLLTIADDDAYRQRNVHALEAQLCETKRHEEIFLRKQVGATLKVRALQLQQAQQILRTRAHRLHDVLDRAFETLRAQQRQQQLKRSFRGLRVAMMARYTTTLCQRAKLRNWLRLCKRLVFWQHNASRFYALRTKYRVFSLLVRNAVWKWKHESAGLSVTLQQRQRLMRKYDGYLQRHGLLDGSAAAARLALTKFSPANGFHGVLLRWVQFTQLIKTHREMVALVHRKHALWQLHTVFQTFKTYLKAKYTTTTRRTAVPFLYRQCVADLEAMHCKVVAVYARLASYTLRRQLKRTQYQLQHTATGAPTLKQRFQLHEQAIRHRLFLESRLLFNAYAERRVHHYAERSSPVVGAPIGRSFAYELAPPYGSISEVIVLCGKQVDAIALVLKTHAAATMEGTLHGNPFGNREVFTLGRNEKLVAIEGFASQSIYGVRFGTSAGRVSKWFGTSEKGTTFELRSDWHGLREEIVGIYGYADATSLHALGCVYRHTTERNIFEGMWLTPPPKGPSESASSLHPHADAPSTTENLSHSDAALCDRQFAYFLQVRMCDVLLAMKRAHRFALRLHRLAPTLPWPLARTRVLLALMRWYFNALAHGLVHPSDREDDGKRLLQDGLAKKAAGAKAREDGARLLADVDSFRDSEHQLHVATLGGKKMTELHTMLQHGERKLVDGQQSIDEGTAMMRAGRQLLPHMPLTKRMLTAIRRMYRVVQTKDYIDQMDPELRAILLAGDADANATPSSIYDPV